MKKTMQGETTINPIHHLGMTRYRYSWIDQGRWLVLMTILWGMLLFFNKRWDHDNPTHYILGFLSTVLFFFVVTKSRIREAFKKTSLKDILYIAQIIGLVSSRETKLELRKHVSRIVHRNVVDASPCKSDKENWEQLFDIMYGHEILALLNAHLAGETITKEELMHKRILSFKVPIKENLDITLKNGKMSPWKMDEVYRGLISKTFLEIDAVLKISGQPETMKLIEKIYIESYLVSAIEITLSNYPLKHIKGKEIKQLIADFKSIQNCRYIADSYELVEPSSFAHKKGVAIVKEVLLNCSKEAQNEFLAETDALNI
ncbi:MAG: hypothetical protein WC059_00155 [Candidatus Paceibacterota bacterium]